MYAVRIKHLLKSITLPKPPIMLQNTKGSDFLVCMKQDFILMLINKTINYQHYGTKTTSAFKDETHKKYFEPKAIKIKCFE